MAETEYMVLERVLVTPAGEPEETPEAEFMWIELGKASAPGAPQAIRKQAVDVDGPRGGVFVAVPIGTWLAGEAIEVEVKHEVKSKPLHPNRPRRRRGSGEEG